MQGGRGATNPRHYISRNIYFSKLQAPLTKGRHMKHTYHTPRAVHTRKTAKKYHHLTSINLQNWDGESGTPGFCYDALLLVLLIFRGGGGRLSSHPFSPNVCMCRPEYRKATYFQQKTVSSLYSWACTDSHTMI